MSQHDDMPHNQDSEDYLGPSKSQLKREMHALQELGKRMLDLSDEQLASLTISDPLKAAIVESRRITQREARRRHHLAERWRDRMITEGDKVVGEFIDYCPSADVQHLRNLVRNARKDVEKEKNTGQSRKLFRALREWIDDAEQ